MARHAVMTIGFILTWMVALAGWAADRPYDPSLTDPDEVASQAANASPTSHVIPGVLVALDLRDTATPTVSVRGEDGKIVKVSVSESLTFISEGQASSELGAFEHLKLDQHVTVIATSAGGVLRAGLIKIDSHAP